MAVQFVKIEVSPHGMAPSSETDALKMIEVCGRTAYKSEDKITPDSAKAFVLMLKKHGHLSVLEHSNAVLRVTADVHSQTGAVEPVQTLQQNLVSCLKERNAYHRTHVLPAANALAIAGNFRGWMETLRYLQDRSNDAYHWLAGAMHRFFPNLFKASESTPCRPGCDIDLLDSQQQLALLKNDNSSDLPVFIFKIVCDRGITHEIVRHRVFSFTQESTRYVNYKNKGMTLILPEELEPYYDPETAALHQGESLVTMWEARADQLFQWYQADVNRGRRPEIARDILPNLLKSEIFVSGRWSGWKHFIELRDSRQAHPRIRIIAQAVRKYFASLGLSCGGDEVHT
ncbi:FAD-dependent thymidylate synthase [Desulfoferrobacter suflitae]|uniref:FAD-dependent thymidylate synthase n=1 Tax=Desulfoferrobacter suflitae TaxID=2865782 RepID=UPI0021642BA6|nr:FAD-dependent thymidylate synthase [Desulfoferrobacter suflitae]MCK8602848.1 FAD-dependent thymidylate synthase [Desulfoferrobacter suflitae]